MTDGPSTGPSTPTSSRPSVLAISGSSSSQSINQTLLRYAVAQAGGAEVELVSVRDFPAPLFSVDIEKEHGVPAPIADLYARIQAADGLIIASPEHNGSMPAMLKNAIDWLSRVQPGQKFMAKPLLLLSTSPGPGGGATNLGNMATLAPWWGAEVMASFSLGRFGDAFGQEEGQLRDEDSAARLRVALESFMEVVGG